MRARRTTGQSTTTESIGTSIPNIPTPQCTAIHGTTHHGHGIGTMDTHISDGTTPHGIGDISLGTGHATPGIGVTRTNGTHSVGHFTTIITDSAHTVPEHTVPRTEATAMRHIPAGTATTSAATMFPAPQVPQEPTEEYGLQHPVQIATTHRKSTVQNAPTAAPTTARTVQKEYTTAPAAHATMYHGLA